MSDVARRINRLLGSSLGVQITRSTSRPLAPTKERLAKLIYFNTLLEQVADVDGDLVECGVADGESLASFASLTLLYGRGRRIWGFDSWAGLPEPTPPDLATGRGIAAKGMFSLSSTKRVHEELCLHGVTPDEIDQHVRLVPGPFSQTLPGFDRPIALLHIDADLYASYTECLTNLWSNIADGGIVAFDEYEQPDIWPGARKAVDEFVASLKGEGLELFRSEISGKWWGVKTR